MKLTDLDARFLKIVDKRTDQHVDDIAEADGVMFQCPLCAQICEPFEEDGRRGFRGAVSVFLTGPGCGWHGFVKNGEAE